nr:RNA-guided pseudouridylation complex pseudouridine synthase subunit Cbf5 [Candidatus Sigynarchaeota archaeon]
MEQRQDRPHKPEFLIRTDASTDPSIGCPPEQRSIEYLVDTGLINLDKPDDYVCHDISSMVKEMFAGTRVVKVGHGGTLDPGVTGVLPLALNRATIVQDMLLSARKEYVGIMHLHGEPGDASAIQTMIQSFVGKIYQMPPDRSAIKHILRMREIDYINVLEINGRNVLFKVGCEAGTYIRKLCVDIGEALGCEAHLQELRRTRSGCFSENDGTLVTLQDIDAAVRAWRDARDGSKLARLVQPMERAFTSLQRIIIKDAAVDAICRGASVMADDVVKIEKIIEKGNIVAIFTQKGEIVARGKSLMPAQAVISAAAGFVARSAKQYMEPGTYPRLVRKGNEKRN